MEVKVKRQANVIVSLTEAEARALAGILYRTIDLESCDLIKSLWSRCSSTWPAWSVACRINSTPPATLPLEETKMEVKVKKQTNVIVSLTEAEALALAGILWRTVDFESCDLIKSLYFEVCGELEVDSPEAFVDAEYSIESGLFRVVRGA